MVQDELLIEQLNQKQVGAFKILLTDFIVISCYMP